MIGRRFATMLAAAMLAAGSVACSDDGPTGLETTPFGAEDATYLTEAIDVLVAGAIADEFVAMSVAPAAGRLVAFSLEPVPFERHRDCPAGGTVMLTGTRDREFDAETGTLTGTFTATKTLEECAHENDRGRWVVNGQLDVIATRVRVGDRRHGTQETTIRGVVQVVRITGDQRVSRECEVDLTTVRDADAHTVTRTGTLCGRTIDVSRTWNPDAED